LVCSFIREATADAREYVERDVMEDLGQHFKGFWRDMIQLVYVFISSAVISVWIMIFLNYLWKVPFSEVRITFMNFSVFFAFYEIDFLKGVLKQRQRTIGA
jgi:hypothetical protein